MGDFAIRTTRAAVAVRPLVLPELAPQHRKMVSAVVPVRDDEIRRMVEPTENIPANSWASERTEGGDGIVVVDFSGTDVDEPFFIQGKRLYGRDEEGLQGLRVEAEEAGSVMCLQVKPGVYRVRWFDSEASGERVVWVRVAAGKMTVVRAYVPGTEDQYPVPAGLGRIMVQVADVEGGPLAGMSVRLVGWKIEEPDEVPRTNRYGQCGLQAPPGHYHIRVGDMGPVSVTVLEGRVQNVSLVPKGLGEIHLEFEAQEGDGVFAIPGEAEFYRESDTRQAGRKRLAYVAPGRYVVTYGERFRQRVGEVVVRAGEAATLSFEAAVGILVVRNATQSHLSVDVTGLRPDLRIANGYLNMEPGGERRVRYLKAGRYRVQAREGPFRPGEIIFDESVHVFDERVDMRTRETLVVIGE